MPLLALALLSVKSILTTEGLERLSRLLLGLFASVYPPVRFPSRFTIHLGTSEILTGVAQVGLVSGRLVANVLGGVVDVLVRLAETGGSDALVRDSLSRHVDSEVICSLVW